MGWIRLDGWTDGQTNRKMDRQTDRQIEEYLAVMGVQMHLKYYLLALVNSTGEAQ